MKNINILVVEDEAIIVEDIRMKLIHLGYTMCGSASSGLSAFKKVEELQPDMILMDIRLKDDIDGIEATKKIQLKYDIPVIYVTAYNDKRTLDRMKKTMPYGFIMKPVNEQELKGVVETALFKHGMEKKLRESEEKYRVLFESASDAIFIMKDMEFVDCNQKALELFNSKKDLIIGKTPLDFSPPVQPDGQLSKEKSMKIWQATQKKGGQSFEWQHIRRDGTSIDVEVHVNKLPLNGETFLVSFVRDITDRKKAERALELEKQFLDGIIEGLPGLFFMIDEQGTMIRWNKNREAILGYSDKELQNRHALDHLIPEDRARVSKQLMQLFKGGTAVSEYTIVTKDGTKIPFFANGKRITIGDKNYVVGLAIDISVRKQMEEKLNEQLAFETLITQLSADFINLPANKIDRGIEKALKSIIGFFGAGRAIIIQPTSDGRNYGVTHAYGTAGLKPIPTSLNFAKQFSYAADRLLKGQDLIFSSLDELPESARVMKQYYLMQGIKSSIAIPLVVGGSTMGSLSIAIFDKERVWDQDIVKRFRLLGEILTNALMRKKSEELLHENEERFRSVVEKSSDGIILTDEQGIIIEWNRAEENMTKIKRTRAMGQPIWDILSQMIPSAYDRTFSKKQLKNSILEACHTGKASWFGKVRELETTLSDNKRHVIQTVTYPIKTERGYRIGSMSRDITQQKLANEALQESEEKYRLLIENVPAVIWTSDPEGRTTYISSNVKKVYGYTPDEIYQKGAELFFNRIHEKDRIRVREAYSQLFAKNKKYNVEYRIQRKDGRWIWLHDKATVTKEINGKEHAFGVFSDVTERKGIEEALKNSEKMYRDLVRTLPDAVSVTDLQGNFTYVSRRTAQLHGFRDVNEMIGRNALEFIAPEYHEKGMQTYQAVREKEHVQTLDCEMIRKDGSRFYGSINIALMKNPSGEVTSVIGTTRDDTLRKFAEQALMGSEKQLSLIVNNVAEAIALIKVEGDGSFRFAEVNQTLLDISNMKKSDILNKRLGDVFPPEVVKYRLEKYKQVVQTKEIVSFEREEKRTFHDGGSIYLETMLIPILDEDGVCTHILAINRDITDSKKAREAERKSQRAYQLASLGTLAAGIAHEINQPLTALMIKTDSLLYWGDEEDALTKGNIISHLRFISDEADKINQIIKHMRSMVRREKTHLESVNIDEVIQRATSLVGQQLKSHGIQLILNFQENMPPVSASKIPMEQVIVNLLSNSMNALDRLEKEDKWIKITTHTFRDKCVIEVQDNGPGIPDDMIDYIFDPLLTTEEDGKGMGLGLAIASYLIEDIGGSIQARTPNEGGALFKISLPLI